MVLISGDNKICPSAFDKKQKPLLTIWTWRASCGALHPFQSSQRCIASSSVKTLLDLSDRHTLIFARQKTKIKVIKQLKPNEIENNRKMKNKKRLGIKLMCVMLSIDWENHHLWHVAGIGFAQISQWAIAAKWKNNKKKNWIQKSTRNKARNTRIGDCAPGRTWTPGLRLSHMCVY